MCVRCWAFVAVLAFELVRPALAQVPHHLLVDAKGQEINTAEQWQQRRAELLELAEDFVYGHMPPKPSNVEVRILSTRSVLDGKATETLAIMLIQRGNRTVTLRLGIIRPKLAGKVPVVIKNDRWLFDLSSIPPGEKRNLYQRSGRKEILDEVLPIAVERGYAICKFIRNDLAIDEPQARETGVQAMYPEYDWGVLAAWAWGYQPVIDYLIAEHEVDLTRIVATGHSRGGKTALAAAIFDPRISIAAPSASGSGGTGSWQLFTPGGSRQTATHFVKKRPCWFSPRLGEVGNLPKVDGHTLRALVAPRGIINTQGEGDSLANPLGTRKMFDASEAVFKLLGAGDRTATHWRPGGHGQTVVDWLALFDYADAYFAGEALPDRFNNWPDDSVRSP